MTAFNSPISDVQLYLRLLAYTKPYLWAFAFSIFGFSLFSFMQVLTADILQFLVDAFGDTPTKGSGMVAGWSARVFTGEYFAWMSVSLQIVTAFFLIAVLRGVGSFIGSYYMVSVGRHIVHGLRCELFAHMVQMPADYFDRNTAGGLVSRITYNVGQVESSITKALTVIVREGATVIGLVSYLLYKNWQLSLAFLAVAPLIALIVRIVSKRFRRISTRLQASVGDVTQITSEMINGNREMRIFSGQSYEAGRFANASKRNLDQTMKMALTDSAFTPLLQSLVALAICVLIWLGLQAKEAHTMSPGDLVAFIGAAALVAKPLRSLTEVLNLIQKGLAACQDVFANLDLAIENQGGGYRVTRARGAVEFEDVCFRYHPSGPEVLKGVSFSVGAGQTVALVGSSGSGKTSLVSLLPLFYRHESGSIRLDGTDIQEYDLNNLREQIALVNQRVTLFNDSVRRNIAYGSLANKSDADIEAAARLANAHEFIIALPQGYDTLIGDNGVNLSGGQRQRLAIARALLKDAPVLILDEATSALDNESERLIQNALERVMEGRTTFVIAHRLSTVEHADLILVMEHGRIVEAGSHQILLSQNGRYAQLYHNHFEDDSADASPA